MNRQNKKVYLIPKIRNLQSIQIKSLLMNKKVKSYKNKSKQHYENQNKSTSFQTVKKLDVSKYKKKSPIQTRINSQRNHLNSTIKKKHRYQSNSLTKSAKKLILKDRSVSSSKSKALSTPKFGQNMFKAQNLTNSRLDLIFQLQNIKKLFNQNLNQISLTCIKSISPLHQNLKKCIMLNKILLQKEWMTIKESFINLKGQKEVAPIQKMIWQYQQKRLRLNQIERNLQKAIQILLI